VLLDAGESTDEQIELLERAHCLNARARAERSAVVALLEQASRALGEANGAADLSPQDDSLWLCDAVRDALRASGFLDELAWATLESGASPDNPRVQWLISQVQTARAVRAGKTPAANGPAWDVANPFVAAADRSAPAADTVTNPFAAVTQRSPAEGTVTCLVCARQLPPAAAFCGYCGQKLSQSD